MIYNLTEKQKSLARTLVSEVRAGNLPESFTVLSFGHDGVLPIIELKSKQQNSAFNFLAGDRGQLDALAEAKMLLQRISYTTKASSFGDQSHHEDNRSCTLTARIYKAVDTNFAEEETPLAPISTLAQPHPPEIAMSLDRLRTKHPDPKKLGFLVMRFTVAKPFAKIVEIIKQTGDKHGLNIIRADENEFHADLWGNVRTHLHGCGFGIAVYERIESEEPNANVGLEVGYLMAMNKPILLLKDKTVTTLQADLAGKLYKEFDPHAPETTIPEQLTKWLQDNGIVVPVK